MPSQTSIENYHEHKRSGKLGDQERELLDFLKTNPNRNYSRQELHKETGIPLASVCGRINTLVAAGLVDTRPNRPCGITGKTITPVRAARTTITH